MGLAPVQVFGRRLSRVVLGVGVCVRLVPHAARCLQTSSANVSIASRPPTPPPSVARGLVAFAAGLKAIAPTSVLWSPMVETHLLALPGALLCGGVLAMVVKLLARLPGNGFLWRVRLVALVQHRASCGGGLALPAMLLALRPCNGLLRQASLMVLAWRGALCGNGLALDVKFMALRPRNGLLRRVWLVVLVHRKTIWRFRPVTKGLQREGRAGVVVRVTVDVLFREPLTLLQHLTRFRLPPRQWLHQQRTLPLASSTGASRLLGLRQTLLMLSR